MPRITMKDVDTLREMGRQVVAHGRERVLENDGGKRVVPVIIHRPGFRAIHALLELPPKPA